MAVAAASAPSMPGSGPCPTSSVGAAAVPDKAGEPLVDLRKLLRVGVFAFVAEEIATGQAAPVRAVDGVAVTVAPLVRIHQPAPADLVLEPIDMPALQRSRLPSRLSSRDTSGVRGFASS